MELTYGQYQKLSQKQKIDVLCTKCHQKCGKHHLEPNIRDVSDKRLCCEGTVVIGNFRGPEEDFQLNFLLDKRFVLV